MYPWLVIGLYPLKRFWDLLIWVANPVYAPKLINRFWDQFFFPTQINSFIKACSKNQIFGFNILPFSNN